MAYRCNEGHVLTRAGYTLCYPGMRSRDMTNVHCSHCRAQRFSEELVCIASGRDVPVCTCAHAVTSPGPEAQGKPPVRPPAVQATPHVPASVDGVTLHGPVPNLGNTCYFAAALHIVAALLPDSAPERIPSNLHSFFGTDNTKAKRRFAAAARDLKSGRDVAAQLPDAVAALGLILPAWAAGQQYDVDKCLSRLLDSRPADPITASVLDAGAYLTTVVSRMEFEGTTKSVAFTQHDSGLRLDMPAHYAVGPHALDDIIDFNIAKRDMNQANCPTCPVTGTWSRATVTSTFAALPHRLRITLKRFLSDQGTLTKDGRLAVVPRFLHLHRWAGPGIPALQLSYRLCAAAIHHGDTLAAGHYTTLLFDNAGNATWWDDGTVRTARADIQYLLGRAYVLAYRRLPHGDALLQQQADAITLPVDARAKRARHRLEPTGSHAFRMADIFWDEHTDTVPANIPLASSQAPPLAGVCEYFADCAGIDMISLIAKAVFPQIPFDQVGCTEAGLLQRRFIQANHAFRSCTHDMVTRPVPTRSMGLYAAGTPCVSFAPGGKRDGLNSKHGRLWLQSLKFVYLNRPTVFALENSSHLATHAAGALINTAIAYASEWGYRVTDNKVGTIRRGIPHARCRHFLIGVRADRCRLNFAWGPECPPLPLAWFLDPHQPSTDPEAIPGTLAAPIAIRESTRRARQRGVTGDWVVNIHHSVSWSRNRSAPAPHLASLTATLSAGPWLGSRHRRLRSHEGIRLQGLVPAWALWPPSQSAVWFLIGNTITGNVAYQLLHETFRLLGFECGGLVVWTATDHAAAILADAASPRAAAVFPAGADLSSRYVPNLAAPRTAVIDLTEPDNLEALPLAARQLGEARAVQGEM